MKEIKNCGECKHFNPESTFDYPPAPSVRECTGGFYKGSFVTPDAPGCPDFEPKPTVFHQITASPEVLAEKLVYAITYGCSVGAVKHWYSTLELGTYFSKKEEAIAATAARLNEVCNAE